MSAALGFFNRSQWSLFAVSKANIVYVYVQFPASCHPAFCLSLGHRRQSYSAARYNNYVFYLDVFKNFKINSLASCCVSGRKISRQAQFYWCAVLKPELQRLLQRRDWHCRRLFVV